MNEIKKVFVLDIDTQQKFHVRARYVLLECTACGKTWGATPEEVTNMISERTFVCRDCAGLIVYEQMNSN